MSDNKLKIDVVLADVGESGAVLSDFVTQEIHNTDMAKKADLVNGKVNPTQLPEFSELIGVTDNFSLLESNLRENINTSLTDSKAYADSIVSEVMSKKADLVNGRVPKEQATNFKDIPGAKAAIDGLKQSLGQEIIGINDSLENNFAKLSNGTVSKTLLPTDLVYSDRLTREMDDVRSSLQNTITQVDEELTALETKTNNKFISKTEAEYFTKDIELKAAIDGLEQKSYTSYASKIVETSKADLAYVDRALGALSTAATKFYPTLALANADITNLTLDQPVQVGEVANGGLWYKATAGATTLTKSPYDPLTQSQKYTNSILEKYSEINSLLSATGKQENIVFYNRGSGKVTKETHAEFFAVEVETKAGEYFILNTQRFGAVPAFLIADDQGNILNLAETQASKTTLAQPYVIKIPENGVKLYVNCSYGYANGFSFSKISKNEIELIYDTTRKEFTFFQNSNGVVTQVPHHECFAKQFDVTQNDLYLIDTKTFGLAPEYIVADVNNNVIESRASTNGAFGAYTIRIPEGGVKLYVSCVYAYVAKFNAEKLSNKQLTMIPRDAKRQDFAFYYEPNGVLTKFMHNEYFSIQLNVKKDQCFCINTGSSGIADEYLILDEQGNVIQKKSPVNALRDYVIKIPENGVKLYVNCSYRYADNFSVTPISKSIVDAVGVRQDFTFYYAPEGILTKFVHDEFFAVQLNVQKDQCFCINTGTFGIADEYLITDDEGNVIQKKPPVYGQLSDYVIKIPENGTKLYVSCSYAYADKFNVTSISKSIVDAVDAAGKNNGVRNVFPTFNYFDKLRLKCPNFYQKFKDKQQDVTVVLTGTSLTQGNLYVSDRADATTRPALLHTNDLASSVFDKLVPHWDGQKYRRYDHADLTYSASSWTVVNRVLDGSADVWDDYAHIKNGLTKTTTNPNASVSMTIPSNAWQFNFVYRSDKQGGNCTVAITEGNSKVEVFNGTNWVEANGYVFSMLESAATATKGNTCYQKRLKMRCKNKALGGINSIGSTKQIKITKANDASRFNVVGFEWSPREFMLSVINGARGSHEWGSPEGYQLEHYQDSDIWEFNPDLILAEITIINWGASDPSAMSKDPLYFVNIAKRAYFNEFNDMPDSLFAKSSGYTACDVVFYSDTLACAPSQSGAWDSVTHEPLFGTVTTAATNGATVDNINVGRTKTNFENHEAVERYMSSKDYLFIPVLSIFKSVAEKYYGSYWQAMQASDKTGRTLSQDAVHFNDNGSALFSKLIASVFEQL